MAKLIRWNRYSREAVLEAKGKMTVREIAPALLENEMEAKKMILSGADHVLYGMKKFNLEGELAGMDFMLMPMDDDHFRKATKMCRNVMIYALHRR